ncbi:hypothetical protein EYF80_034540 [Liparis tanakae]|uniref:Uncharacterized protein n=1 Tax=Liparis tanakae TaxID=230148 RepID=A0A4Z2GRI2_9TELE|nr:hypothetical protein EYF80_034540 [Liparis tanakae]
MPLSCSATERKSAGTSHGFISSTVLQAAHSCSVVRRFLHTLQYGSGHVRKRRNTSMACGSSSVSEGQYGVCNRGTTSEDNPGRSPPLPLIPLPTASSQEGSAPAQLRKQSLIFTSSPPFLSADLLDVNGPLMALGNNSGPTPKLSSD